MDEMQSILNEAPGRKFGTCGKGDADRVRNKGKFAEGYTQIAWGGQEPPLRPGQFRKFRKVYK